MNDTLDAHNDASSLLWLSCSGFWRNNSKKNAMQLTQNSTIITVFPVSWSILVFPWNMKKTKAFPKNSLQQKKNKAELLSVYDQ